jgi:feruloyl esterase
MPDRHASCGHVRRALRHSALLLVAWIAVPHAAQAATCESLSALRVSRVRITQVETVAAGRFPAPAGRGGAASNNPFSRLPAFCRVAATIAPSPRSEIKMEVWLPAAGWNGKLQVVGNGAFAGTIGYPAMATALAAGYATASTDTGHTGPSSNTFVNQDVLVDFAYRAVHETTVAAKKLLHGFYDALPKQAYFNGCSTGGRQALTAAQRYPEDFTGIVAGAPASFGSKQTFGQIWIYQATADAASALPREKLVVLHNAVLQQCDNLDGVRDGVLANPLACKFDPRTLACTSGGEGGTCLTAPQVEAVRRIYDGASNPKTGEPIFPGFERGSELGWSPAPVGYAVDYFKYVVFKNPGWDPKTLDFAADIRQAGKSENQIFDATNPDLSSFTARGGKLLMYQGWGDQGIPPRNVVDYYGLVREKTRKAADAVRLFMVPGMGHCGGGDGTSTFDMAAALDQWVTTGKAPAQISASRVRDGRVDRTRPLCPWPQVAANTGSGSADDAASFVCK